MQTKKVTTVIFLISAILSHTLYDRIMIGLHLGDKDPLIRQYNEFGKLTSPIMIAKNAATRVSGAINMLLAYSLFFVALHRIVTKGFGDPKTDSVLRKIQILKIISNTLIFGYDIITLSRQNKMKIIYVYNYLIIYAILYMYNFRIQPGSSDKLVSFLVMIFPILVRFGWFAANLSRPKPGFFLNDVGLIIVGSAQLYEAVCA